MNSGGANSIRLMKATDINEVRPKVLIKLAICKIGLLLI